jgi:hypothetical protein
MHQLLAGPGRDGGYAVDFFLERGYLELEVLPILNVVCIVDRLHSKFAHPDDDACQLAMRAFGAVDEGLGIERVADGLIGRDDLGREARRDRGSRSVVLGGDRALGCAKIVLAVDIVERSAIGRVEHDVLGAKEH